MWSVGCILAELYLGKVLFGKKESSKQVKLLIKLLGLPPKHLFEKMADRNLREYMRMLNLREGRLNFQDIIPEIEPDALDLLQKLLEYDPECRITAE